MYRQRYLPQLIADPLRDTRQDEFIKQQRSYFKFYESFHNQEMDKLHKKDLLIFI